LVSAQRIAQLLVIVVLVVGCGPSKPAPSDEPQSAALTSELPDAARWTWSAISPATARDGVGLDTIAIGPKGLATTSSRGDQILWTSDDGAAWRWTPAPSLAGSIILDLVAGPDGDFIAAGFMPDRAGLLVQFDAAGAEVNEVGGPETFVTSIESTGAGFVAAGGAFDGTSDIASTWRSTDADAWDTVAGPHDAAFGPFLVSPRGWIGASNAGAAELGNGRADLWLSTDGREWRIGASINDATVNGIVATDDGFIAAGAFGSAAHDFHPALWHSTDGRSWARIDRKEITGTLSTVVRWRDGFVAVGSAIQKAGGGLIWVSRDGLTWSDVEGIPLRDLRLDDAATSDSQLVIVGEKGGESLVLLVGLPE
jgi:hypothetical protein